MRLAAVLLGAALLAGTLYLVLQPSFRIAYVHGGVRFYTYPILAALILPLALVTTARLSDRRWAPLGLLLVLLPVGIAGGTIARAGFAWLQPVSVIEEEIGKDPTSPSALATIIARKNRTPPGQVGGLGLYALIPAAVMVLVDARRRPVWATLAYAGTLFAVSGWLMARLPAFQPLVPGPADGVDRRQVRRQRGERGLISSPGTGHDELQCPCDVAPSESILQTLPLGLEQGLKRGKVLHVHQGCRAVSGSRGIGNRHPGEVHAPGAGLVIPA